jgi:hypothetical protein
MKSTLTRPQRLKALLLAAGSCLPLHAADLAFTLLPEVDNQQLGTNFAAVGDIDGDGTADLAISDPGYRANGTAFGSGVVFIVSGADGSHLRTYTPEAAAASQFFGIALAALDANGDGVTDLAVGAPGYSGTTGYGTGMVRIYSGTDGALLTATTGVPGSQFGGALANAGDQNGDGADDLFIGASTASSNRGAVHVQSGTDGSTLRTIDSDIGFSFFATALATIGDIDGDGLADVAVGAYGFRSAGIPVGRVTTYRSSDGAVGSTLLGASPVSRLGYTLAPAADANGDGIADLMVGSFSGGGAFLVSGADLTTIRDLSIAGLPVSQPVNVGGSLDFDGDEIADCLIGSPALNPLTPTPAGGIRIISGADSSVLFEHLAATPFTGLGAGMKPLPDFGFAAGENMLTDSSTGGKGLANFWYIEQEIPIPDTDGDGVLDDVDAVVNSIMDPTVSILGVNSTVPNRVDATGTTLADRFSALPALDLKKPGRYLTAVLLLAHDLVRTKVVTSKEAVRLVAAGAAGILQNVCRR